MKYVTPVFSAISAFLSRNHMLNNVAIMLKFTGNQARSNLMTLLKFFFVLVATILVFAGIFKGIMFWMEGRSFSWITSIYWTLTVMSTLGFGDIKETAMRHTSVASSSQVGNISCTLVRSCMFTGSFS